MNKLPQDVQHHVRSLESLATMVPAGIAADAIRQAADFVRTQAQSLVESQAGQRHWKANHDNMVSRLRIFTQRQDLPKNLADRLPWYREMVTLQEQVAQLCAQLAAVQQEQHPLHQHLLHMLGASSHEEAGAIIAKLHACELAAVQQGVQRIQANCYSDNDGDSWRDCPDDCDFVEGLKVGDTFELQASIRAWSETYRVTKAPDDTSDDYEVELVSSDAPIAPHPTQQGLDAQGMYYLQDARWSAMVGNCPSFWREGGGYTTNLDEAERFTFDAAMKQHNCRDTDLPWLCAEVDKLRHPTVDCQYMPRSWDEQRAALAAQAKQVEPQKGDHVWQLDVDNEPDGVFYDPLIHKHRFEAGEIYATREQAQAAAQAKQGGV